MREQAVNQAQTLRTSGLPDAAETIEELVSEVDRQRDLLTRALAIITSAIMCGMPITPEVAAVRNAIVCPREWSQ